MKYKKIITAILIAGSITAFFGFTKIDDDPIAKIAAQLEKWFTTHPQEKVYLQLDKPYYAIGDDMWFKAYITTGPNHELSGISGVLNVELINERDSVKQRIKLPVVNGLTWGDFALADSLKEGNYRIRAYTNWMRNAGEDYFFDKTIAIVNSISNSVFTKADYAYSSQNGQQRVSSVINYVDLNGTPYANAPVSYEVELGTKTISKGKGQTDDKGNLDISFVNTAPDLMKSGRITTNIKLDKKTITKSVLIKATSDKVDVQFFPEGGTLVNDNYSKIAFKAVAADGLGTDVKGVLIDDQNNQVATFSSTHLGMGAFYFKPENGKTYKAKLTYVDGSENTVALPNAVNTGYSLSVNDAGPDNIRVRIVGGPSVIANTSSTEVISLIGQSGGAIYYASKSKPGSSVFTATIPKDKFPSGIAQFTLFSSTGEPLNERLVFVQNHDQLKLDVATEKQTYAPREKVKIDLNAKSETDKPMVGSFSVAVTDEAKVPVDENENTILSNLLLTSDIKGYIEKPGYYFNTINEKTEADLDMLMLTQGYHRFEWKQVENNTVPAIAYQPERTLEISGHLKTLGGKPIAKGKVTLFTNQGGLFLIDTVSDDEGRFVFKNLVFKDSVKFMVQGRTSKDRKFTQLDIDNVDFDKPGKNKNAADLQVNISNAMSPYLQNSKAWYSEQLKYGINNGSIQLKEVVIKEKKEPVIKDSQNLNGPGNANQVLTSDAIAKLGGCAVITDCLQGRLTGVIFRNGVPYSTRSLNRSMEIILDGITVDADLLMNLNPYDIESIEVLRSIDYTAIYGGRGSGGVLVITSKKGGSDTNFMRYAPGVITYTPRGFHKIRQFYSPQYDDPKTNTKIPDLRSTIYWKPNILTGKDGKASFEFFNADTKGTYRVTVEGIDQDGNLGRQVYHYEVK